MTQAGAAHDVGPEYEFVTILAPKEGVFHNSSPTLIQSARMKPRQ